MDHTTKAAVEELRNRLVQGDGRDVVVREVRPISIFVGSASREGRETETRKVSTSPKVSRYIG